MEMVRAVQHAYSIDISVHDADEQKKWDRGCGLEEEDAGLIATRDDGVNHQGPWAPLSPEQHVAVQIAFWDVSQTRGDPVQFPVHHVERRHED